MKLVFYSILYLVLALWTGICPAAESANRIVREIKCAEGALWVEDALRFTEDFSLGQPALGKLFEAIQSGNTNPLSEVKALLEPDEVTIVSVHVKSARPAVDLTVRSRVTFKEAAKPARLRWAATFGGTTLKFPSVSVGRTGGEMLAYEEKGQFFLRFPDLGAVTPEFLNRVAEFKKAFEDLPRQMSDQETEIRCVIHSDNTPQDLVRWWNVPKTSGVPTTQTLRRIHEARSLTHNELMSLVTNVRLATPGVRDVRPIRATEGDRKVNLTRQP